MGSKISLYRQSFYNFRRGEMEFFTVPCYTDKKTNSFTTVNTPHRGCEFADYMLSKAQEAQQKAIAKAYNLAAAKLGDVDPDFMAAVTDLTSAVCTGIRPPLRSNNRKDTCICRIVAVIYEGNKNSIRREEPPAWQ